MTTEITRENVQQIIDRHAAENQRKEVDMYRQEYKLRRIINDNHATKTLMESQRAEKRAKEEAEARSAALLKRQQERAERAQEANECNRWYQLMIRVFAPILVAAVAAFFASVDWLPLWLAVPIVFAGCTLGAAAFAIWCWFEYRSIALSLLTKFKNNH